MLSMHMLHLRVTCHLQEESDEKRSERTRTNDKRVITNDDKMKRAITQPKHAPYEIYLPSTARYANTVRPTTPKQVMKQQPKRIQAEVNVKSMTAEGRNYEVSSESSPRGPITM